MPETVQGILDDVISEASVDATPTQVLRDLNRRWAQMLCEARAYRRDVTIGPTVANQAFYAAPMLELYALTVGGVPYGKGRRTDVYDYSVGALTWVGRDGGLAVADADASGIQGLTLIPTPTVGGQAIEAFAAVIPPALTTDPAGDALLNANLEPDLIEPLTGGVLASRYWREGRPDMAGVSEQRFDQGSEKLRRRAARRYHNQGPAMIRVIGLNA